MTRRMGIRFLLRKRNRYTQGILRIQNLDFFFFLIILDLNRELKTNIIFDACDVEKKYSGRNIKSTTGQTGPRTQTGCGHNT